MRIIQNTQAEQTIESDSFRSNSTQLHRTGVQGARGETLIARIGLDSSA